MFLIILVVVAVINITSSHVLAVINNISVWWHVAGAAAVIGILFLVPEHHASVADVFGKTINNSGTFQGVWEHDGVLMPWACGDMMVFRCLGRVVYMRNLN